MAPDSTIDDEPFTPHLAGEGDKVVLRWTARGTHRGEFLGIAPTGRVSRPRREHASDEDWWEFSEAAARIVLEVELSRIGGVRRILRLRAADPSWLAHMAPLGDWCLG